MPVDQSRFNQHFVFAQAIEWKLVVFVLGDAIENVCFILDFD